MLRTLQSQTLDKIKIQLARRLLRHKNKNLCTRGQEMLYDTDILLWSEQQAELLRTGRFNELDLENIIEEIKDLGKRERDKFISSIRLIIHHLLKWEYQPEKRSSSWEITIKRERNHIKRYLRDTPSLKQYWEKLSNIYDDARADASNETGIVDWEFPDDCPYTQEQIEDDWWPV